MANRFTNGRSKIRHQYAAVFIVNVDVAILPVCDESAMLTVSSVFVMPNSHRRRDKTVEFGRVGGCSVNCNESATVSNSDAIRGRSRSLTSRHAK